MSIKVTIEHQRKILLSYSLPILQMRSKFSIRSHDLTLTSLLPHGIDSLPLARNHNMAPDAMDLGAKESRRGKKRYQLGDHDSQNKYLYVVEL